MSLLEADWKRELAKPKNLGLKAGGTGVSDAMRTLKTLKDKLAKDYAARETQLKLNKAYKELIKTCDAVVKKHEKLFTEACKYLKAVHAEATKEHAKYESKMTIYDANSMARSGLQEAAGGLLRLKDNKAAVAKLEAIHKAVVICSKTIPGAIAIRRNFEKKLPTWKKAATKEQLNDLGNEVHDIVMTLIAEAGKDV